MTRLRVVIAGGDVAALETAFALRALAGDHVNVTLVAPTQYLEYRPVQVRDPLAVNGRSRVPLARLAREAGAGLRHDRVVAIDTLARRLHTAVGYELPYDVLVVAAGAVPQDVPAGALALDEGHAAECRFLMCDLRAGRLASVAFVEPPAPAFAFDLYDLAIETAAALRAHRVDANLTLVTAEAAPLAVLGRRVAGMLGETLRAHGLRVVESSYVRSIANGRIEVAPGSRSVEAERVIATPRLAGPHVHGLPCEPDGFLRVDVNGRVAQVDGVFAAGACTSFPVKHPSLSAQQADAVAAAIAAAAGARVVAAPFTPVLRCILPSRLRWYVEAPLTGGVGDATLISAFPSWPQPLRFGSRFLASQLQPKAHTRQLTVRTASDATHTITTAMVTP